MNRHNFLRRRPFSLTIRHRDTPRTSLNTPSSVLHTLCGHTFVLYTVWTCVSPQRYSFLQVHALYVLLTHPYPIIQTSKYHKATPFAFICTQYTLTPPRNSLFVPNGSAAEFHWDNSSHPWLHSAAQRRPILTPIITDYILKVKFTPHVSIGFPGSKDHW